VASKIAGLAGDFGSGATTTVIGLASGLASLAVELTQLGIDIREMRAGNKRLEKPESLDKSVFAECPLVGSYLIAYSPTSIQSRGSIPVRASWPTSPSRRRSPR
jgi:hypothetical protein